MVEDLKKSVKETAEQNAEAMMALARALEMPKPADSNRTSAWDEDSDD